MSWFARLRKSNGVPQRPTPPTCAPEDANLRVRVYDVPTKTLSTIPARELAPGMVEVRMTMEGVEERCWVDPSQLQKSPYQHPPFDEDIRDILRQIKSSLDDVYPQTLEQWEDGFRRDHNAEREIAIWLHVAERFRRLTEDKALTPAERQDVFRVLLGCANNPREQVPRTAGVQALSRVEVEAVMAEFYGDQRGST